MLIILRIIQCHACTGPVCYNYYRRLFMFLIRLSLSGSNPLILQHRTAAFKRTPVTSYAKTYHCTLPGAHERDPDVTVVL